MKNLLKSLIFFAAAVGASCQTVPTNVQKVGGGNNTLTAAINFGAASPGAVASGGTFTVQSGGTFTLASGSTFNAGTGTIPFSALTSLPTTLSGYGITDGVNSVVSATNVLGAISGHQLTLTQTGQLAIALGGTNAASASAAFNNLSPMTTLGDVIYGGASGAGTRLAGSTSATKMFLSQTGTGTVSAAPAWGTLSSGDIPALAYVSSVALSMPGVFSVAGTPITSSGTFTVTLGTETANTVWAGPTTGAASAPTFRSLVTNDIPTISLSTGVNGTLQATQVPIFTGDMTTAGGTLTTVVSKVNGVSHGTNPSTNTVAVVTSANATTYEAVPNAALANSSVTINGNAVSLGGSTTVAAAAGSLTGTTLNATVVNSSLTALGTIVTGVWNGTAIANANLANSSVTIGSTSISLGATVSTFAGVTLTSPTLNSPTLVTPALGAATATSINGLTITSSTGTLTIANGKTHVVSNSLTFTGTDSTSFAFPGTSDTVAGLAATQTLTNKSISGSTNTLSAIANGSLTNSAVTVNGTSISLGASGTVTAGAGTLTGTALNSTVVTSSLTSVGTLGALTVSGTTTLNTGLTGILQATAGVISAGTLSIANGGTNGTTANGAFNNLSPMTTLGDTIYGAASGVGTRLAGSTSASKVFLTQTGTGSISAIPAWGGIVAGDLPLATTGAFGAVKPDGTTITISGGVITASASSGAFGSNISTIFSSAGTVSVEAQNTNTAGVSDIFVRNDGGSGTSAGADLETWGSAATGTFFGKSKVNLAAVTSTNAATSAFIVGSGNDCTVYIGSNGAIAMTIPDTNVVTFANTIVGSVNGNAGTATVLATARAINGVNFDGSAAITVAAAAGTLTGATLASGVTASSLTSAAGGAFGTGAYAAQTVLTGTSGQIAVTNGGAGATTVSIPVAVTGINSITSAATNDFIIATGTFGTSVDFASATGIPTFATNVNMSASVSGATVFKNLNSNTAGDAIDEVFNDSTASAQMQVWGSLASGSNFGASRANLALFIANNSPLSGLGIGTITSVPVIIGTGNTAAITIGGSTQVVTFANAPAVSPFSTAGIVTNNSSGVMASLSNNSSPSTPLMNALGSGWSNTSGLFLAANGTWEAAAGGGTVTTSASPASTYVSYFTGPTTISGNSGATEDTSGNFVLNSLSSAGKISSSASAAATPNFAVVNSTTLYGQGLLFYGANSSTNATFFLESRTSTGANNFAALEGTGSQAAGSIIDQYTTDQSGIDTGSFFTTGGASIHKSLIVGTSFSAASGVFTSDASGNVASNSLTALGNVIGGGSGGGTVGGASTFTLGESSTPGGLLVNCFGSSNSNIGSLGILPQSANGSLQSVGALSVFGALSSGSVTSTYTTASTSTTTGAFQTLGGIGVAKAGFFGTLVSSPHFVGAGTAPTIAAGTGAGTSPTVSVSGHDAAFTVSVTTGTLPTLGATIATVTFNTAYANAPHFTLTPSNGNSALLSGATMVYPTSTTTTYVLTAGTSALTAATAYTWEAVLTQ